MSKNHSIGFILGYTEVSYFSFDKFKVCKVHCFSSWVEEHNPGDYLRSLVIWKL